MRYTAAPIPAAATVVMAAVANVRAMLRAWPIFDSGLPGHAGNGKNSSPPHYAGARRAEQSVCRGREGGRGWWHQPGAA